MVLLHQLRIASQAFVLFGGGDLNLWILVLFKFADSTIGDDNDVASSNNPNESYTRYPDVTGDFVQHAGAVDSYILDAKMVQVSNRIS